MQCIHELQQSHTVAVNRIEPLATRGNTVGPAWCPLYRVFSTRSSEARKLLMPLAEGSSGLSGITSNSPRPRQSRVVRVAWSRALVAATIDQHAPCCSHVRAGPSAACCLYASPLRRRRIEDARADRWNSASGFPPSWNCDSWIALCWHEVFHLAHRQKKRPGFVAKTPRHGIARVSAGFAVRLRCVRTVTNENLKMWRPESVSFMLAREGARFAKCAGMLQAELLRRHYKNTRQAYNLPRFNYSPDSNSRNLSMSPGFTRCTLKPAASAALLSVSRP